MVNLRNYFNLTHCLIGHETLFIIFLLKSYRFLTNRILAFMLTLFFSVPNFVIILKN